MKYVTEWELSGIFFFGREILRLRKGNSRWLCYIEYGIGCFMAATVCSRPVEATGPVAYDGGFSEPISSMGPVAIGLNDSPIN